MRLGLGLGVKNSVFVGGYDSATSAFLAATGITSKTESDAVNSLVLNLKSYGLWSKMKAIYPFVSDTYNLLSYSQILTNGNWVGQNTTASLESGLTPLNTPIYKILATGTISQFYQNNIQTVGLVYSDIALVKKGNCRYIFFKQCNNTKYDFDTNTFSGTYASNMSSELLSDGWVLIKIAGYTSTNTLFSIYQSNNLNPSGGVSGDFTYLSYFQTSLSSTVLTYQPIATTPANRFVSQFKYNLKDARDLDAAFRLAFNGTWTYSKQGATPNGVNAFANTYVNPTTLGFTQTDTHISAYLRTDSNGSKVDIGGSYNLFMGVRWANNYNYPINRSNNANGTSANSIGYFLASRVDNVRDRMYKNGTNVTNFNGAAVSLDNNTIMISATNGGGLYSDRQTAFNTIGNGLTDTEVSNLYSSIQTFQTALARQV